MIYTHVLKEVERQQPSRSSLRVSIIDGDKPPIVREITRRPVGFGGNPNIDKLG